MCYDDVYVCVNVFVHNQVLHLTHSAIGKLSIGHIVNVASTDVQRFDLVHITLVVTRTAYVYKYLCSYRHFIMFLFVGYSW